MKWDKTARVKMVELFVRLGSIVGAQRAFRRETGSRAAPDPHTIRGWVARFRAQGSVARKPYTQRRPRHGQDVDKIQRLIRRNPTLSLRRLARRTGIPKSTVRGVLRKRLQLHPYKLQLLTRLMRGDKAKRIRACRWLLGKLKGRQFRRFLFMSDEAHFHLDGAVCKQNCRVWSDENPHAFQEKDLNPSRVTVWCALSRKEIIGPYFFEEGAQTVTVTSVRYRAMLEQFVLPELQRRDIDVNKVWFQQDAAAPHTANAVLSFLGDSFGSRVISKGAATAWPPMSPDLTTADFFLWGHLKAAVYHTPVKTLSALKTRIRRAIRAVTPEMLSAAADAFALRCRRCVVLRGGHLENLLTRH